LFFHEAYTKKVHVRPPEKLAAPMQEIAGNTPFSDLGEMGVFLCEQGAKPSRTGMRGSIIGNSRMNALPALSQRLYPFLGGQS
jgi:hypothetical protein